MAEALLHAANEKRVPRLEGVDSVARQSGDGGVHKDQVSWLQPRRHFVPRDAHGHSQVTSSREQTGDVVDAVGELDEMGTLRRRTRGVSQADQVVGAAAEADAQACKRFEVG